MGLGSGDGLLPLYRVFDVKVKEAALQPVHDADGVEGDDDLQIIRELRAQSDVQLVEVALQHLAGLFNPDARDVVDGFQLFHIVEASEDYLAAVDEADIHIAAFPSRDVGDVLCVVLVCLVLQLLKAALSQRLCHLSYHQPPVPRLRCHPLQYLAACEDALAAAAAAFQHQIPVLILEQRHEGLVVGLPQIFVPQGDFIQAVYLCPFLFVHASSPSSPSSPARAAARAACSALMNASFSLMLIPSVAMVLRVSLPSSTSCFCFQP